MFSETLDNHLHEFLTVFIIYREHNKELDSGCWAGYTPGGRDASLIKVKPQRLVIWVLEAPPYVYFSKPQHVAPGKVFKVNLTLLNAPHPQLPARHF